MDLGKLVALGIMTTEYLLNRELEHVLAALTPSNRLVMRVMLRTGMRVSDVLKLKTDDLANRMWVLESKTGKRRQVGLGNALLADIQVQAGRTWAFPGVGDPKKPRTRQAVWWDVKRAAKAFRLPQNVGTHSARKVFAVELMAKYGDVGRVQRVLRHDNMATTLIYAMADKLLEARLRGHKGKKRAPK
jgi:integrase